MENVKKIFGKMGFLFFFILPAILIQHMAQSEMFLGIARTVQSHIALYFLALCVLKALSIIYPPMPGVVFTIASIPLIGWELAYFADIVGSTFGATVSYFLGKKYGYSILKKVIGKFLADKIKAIKLKERNQIEAALFLRFASGGLLSDGIAWGASLIGFKYAPFIIGYLVSHLVTTLPIFYFISASISLHSWVIGGIGIIIAWLVLYRFKGRYFE